MLLNANLHEMWFYGWLKIPTYFGWKDAQLHAFKKNTPLKLLNLIKKGKLNQLDLNIASPLLSNVNQNDKLWFLAKHMSLRIMVK
jgi:hypothetical protein